MDGFRLFIEQTEEQKNIAETMSKIPKSHAALIKGFKFKFLRGNTLTTDDNHIGLINPDKKIIILAGPWRYGREFTFLHELAHNVWNAFMTPQLKKQWAELTKKAKKKKGVEDDDQELFCHAYGNTYANHKIVIYDNPDWDKFIKTKVPQ